MDLRWLASPKGCLVLFFGLIGIFVLAIAIDTGGQAIGVLPTNVPAPTATATETPTLTPIPADTDTPVLTETAAPQAVVIPTDTPAPLPTPAPSATAVPSATPQPPTSTPMPTATRPAHMGTDVSTGDLHWRVNSADDLGNTLASDSDFTDDAHTSGRFMRVNFTVENRGTQPDQYEGVKLQDGQGRIFQEYDRSYEFLPDDQSCSFLDTLNPNLPRTCTEIFELPADANSPKLFVSNWDLFSPIEHVIDLVP